MLEIKKAIAARAVEKIKEINPQAEISAEDIAAMLEYPPDSAMGDLALPCFKLSRTLRMSPVKIAQTVAEGFELAEVERAEAVNGYFNIFLNGDALCKKVIGEVREKGEHTALPI